MALADSLDPTRFDLTNASPELRAEVERIRSLNIPSMDRPLTPAEARIARQPKHGGGVFKLPLPIGVAAVHKIDGRAGDIELHCYHPQTGAPRATMLQIHGGGWFSGSADKMEAMLADRANVLNIVIASVEYRLAPENPYPAGPDDCEMAAVWLSNHSRSELGAELMLIGGASAGAHLAAVTVLRMRDRHGFLFRGANLVYGQYDLSGVPSHTQFDGKGLLLDGPTLRSHTKMFVPQSSNLSDPDISPLYANLSGLCPARFTVGTLDPLLDQTLFMHAKWIAAGNAAEIEVFPGGPHGFDLLPVPEAERAKTAANRFLDRCIADTVPFPFITANSLRGAGRRGASEIQ